MKKLVVILVLISLVGIIPIQAQDGNTRFQWDPYDFSVDLFTRRMDSVGLSGRIDSGFA